MSQKKYVKKNVKPTEVYEKNLKQQQVDGSIKDVTLNMYTYRSKKMNMKQIQKFTDEMKQKYNKAGVNARITTVIETPFGHRSGKWTDTNEEHIMLWNPTIFKYNSVDFHDNHTQEVDWYNNMKGVPKSFSYIVEVYNKKGGADDSKNDCFYNCLYKKIKDKVTQQWKFPSSLKRALHIPRDAMIEEEHILKVENWLNVGIFVSGDMVRTPTGNHKTSINLHLQNEHYSVESTVDDKKKINNISYKERIPITYFFNKEQNMYNMYDGKTTTSMTQTAFYKINNIRSKYIYI